MHRPQLSNKAKTISVTAYQQTWTISSYSAERKKQVNPGISNGLCLIFWFLLRWSHQKYTMHDFWHNIRQASTKMCNGSTSFKSISKNFQWLTKINQQTKCFTWFYEVVPIDSLAIYQPSVEFPSELGLKKAALFVFWVLVYLQIDFYFWNLSFGRCCLSHLFDVRLRGDFFGTHVSKQSFLYFFFACIYFFSTKKKETLLHLMDFVF